MKVKPVAADRLPDLLRAMPKAELHMHIEGSLEPELIFALAARNRLAFPYPDVASLRAAYVFENLQSFLDLYHAGTQVLRTEQDFYDMAHAYLARAHADHVLHAEIFFDTQTHTGHGVDAGVVIRGLHRACTDAAAQFGAAHVEAVEGADVAAGLADGESEPAERAGHVVEPAVEGDGECGSGGCGGHGPASVRKDRTRGLDVRRCHMSPAGRSTPPLRIRPS
jgi:hypothetical protein